ncbi:MAG: TonB-dependent receptor [Muribaculaceae bacterium]|jgi:TonB-linked SusC/RagA family outer membrane protein
MKKLTLFLIAIMTCLGVSAQNVSVSGTVVSAADGEPLIGASVMVKGSSTGTATDIDGNFNLQAPDGKTLVISYVGYTAQELKVNGAMSGIEIRLVEDSQVLDDVVVVGYGTQKKSVVTAAISKIDEDKLAASAPVRVDNALKGLTSGVTVTSSSGQPGAAAQVRIRGIGTINNSNPLYIVDGMPIEGGLDYLNPTDIKSIEVLKDAASGAVYGARAANGVVLVTTKNGSKGKTTVTYDFSYGWQTASKHRKVLNATEYAVMMNEGSLNSGVAAPYANPYSYGEGFDWQNAVFNDNAPVMNHQVSMSGASDKVNYYLSLGYYKQDGIVGGNFGRSNYNRLTLRSNNIYTLFDASAKRSWLNKLTVTTNLSYARIKSTGIETNSTWGSPLGSALSISPMLTPYAEGDFLTQQQAYYATNTEYIPMYSADGRLLLNPEAFGNYQEMSNPIANMSLPASWEWSHKFVGNFIGELQIWDNLKYRISYGADLGFWGSDGYTKEYYLRSGATQKFSSAWANSEKGVTWQLENILSYDKTIGDHDFAILLGQSAKASHGDYISASRNHIIDYNKPYIDASSGLAENGDMSAGGAPRIEAKLASLFARASYNYAGRYMAQFTIRRDGSSRFGSNNHWATFPSFSLGWNITSEPWLEKRPTWWNTTKVRFSWGKNGNENIGDLLFVALANAGNNAIFGSSENIVNGTKASILPNANLRWEESQQTDIGIDFGFLNNSLTFTIDYYKKKTNGMLMNMQVPAYVGESVPVGNVGKMENSGVEMEINYRHTFGDFSFGVGGNLTYLKNKLIDYGNAEGWANLDSFQGTGSISRAENGLPFPFFYGYKTDGIIQNQAEADEYNAKYSGGYFIDAVPGDVRFVDVNGDGSITEDDRTMIGKGMPDWTYGFNVNASWKGFTLSAMFQGVWGNQIYDATRRTDARASNLPAWMLNRWTGEGTSNRIPRFVIADPRNWASSDLLVHDGDYFRLKNIMLSYQIPQNLTRRFFVESLRVFVSAENLFTCTKYHGFDPEISSGGTSLGIDYGVYPQPRIWTVGFNIQF